MKAEALIDCMLQGMGNIAANTLVSLSVSTTETCWGLTPISRYTWQSNKKAGSATCTDPAFVNSYNSIKLVQPLHVAEVLTMWQIGVAREHTYAATE